MSDQPRNPGRRAFLTDLALAAATAPLASKSLAAPRSTPIVAGTEPFFGRHQSGILTPMQKHCYFLALDLTTSKREDVANLLKRWTEAAARLTSGAGMLDLEQDAEEAPTDGGDALGLPPSRLTITFGFGAGLFEKEGKDRFGLLKQRPPALAELPRFPGDKLVPERCGGDLSLQACADDPQVAMHAIRLLSGLAYDTAKIRWAQTGFIPGYKDEESPRNLMGFKDGTLNLKPDEAAALKQYLWAGDEGPSWMVGGSYMVVRPIRIALEHWDRMKLAFQEQTIGRHKYSGAPIGKPTENAPLDLAAQDRDGNPIIAENAHVRLAAPEANDGVRLLRRSYSYENGVSFIAERWPPWRQAMEFDAGLLFQCYQRDPRTGFSKLFDKMSRFDMLNQFTTHVGSGLFACPPGVLPGESIGQPLFG